MKSRVLLVADSFEQGANGIARVARLMARVLAEEIALGHVEGEAVALRGGGEGLPIEVRSMRGSRIALVAAVHRAALTHSHFLYDFTGIARAHPRIGALARPYLTWIHGIEAWEDAEEKRLARARGADTLLANSQYTLERAQASHRGLEHAEVCWLATERDDAGDPRESRNSHAPIVTILARLDEGGGYKGHRELIACLPEVLARVPDARLRVIGKGPGREVIGKLVADSPVRAQIDMVGFVPEHALGRLFAESAVLAMPSRGEGFGLAYAEAMRHAVPVIGSVHDAAREVNVSGVTGYNVDLAQPGELAARIVELLTQPELARAMGRAAQAHWTAELRYSCFAARFRPILQRFLTR